MLPVSHCILVQQPAYLSLGQFFGCCLLGLRWEDCRYCHLSGGFLELGSDQMCGADRETEGAHTAVTATRVGCGRKLAKPG